MAVMFKKTSPVRSKSIKVKRRVVDPKKRMLIKQLVIGLVVFSCLGLIVAGFWYGTRIKSLTIDNVSVTGGETISPNLIKLKVEETLSGTYLGIIPRRFSWWYPHDEIMDQLATIPRIKSSVVERISATALKVNFEEYEPYALWCQERNSENCFFIDKYGYAFAESPHLKGGAFLRFHTIGTDPKVRETMVEISNIKKMEEFVMLVEKNFKLPIDQIETDSSGDVFYIVAGGGELKASLKDATEKVVANLQAILSSKEFKHIKPGNFQYIDLRFGNKVFVNEEIPGVSSSTISTTSSLKMPAVSVTSVH